MTLEKALSAEEAARKRPQATFERDVPVKVTFSKRSYTKTDENEDEVTFHHVYVNGEKLGEAHLSEHWSFDVTVYVHRSVQPYAFQILHATEQAFDTRNIRVLYYD